MTFEEAPTAAAPPPPKRLWLRRAATTFVAVAALVFVVWMVPFKDRCTADGCEPGLFTTLSRTNAPLLAALFGVYLLGTLAWAARWRALLGLAEVKLSLLDTWRITLEAQAGGILLPGGIAGDALRVAHVHARAPEVVLPKVFASLLADRIIGLVTLATLAALAGLVFPGTKRDTALLLAAIPVASLLGWLVVRRPAVARSRFLTGSKLGTRLVQPILEYAASERGPRAMGKGLLLSLLVSGTQLLVVRGIIAALGVTPEHEALVYVGTTFGMMVAALPMAPGSWGTADAAYVFFLGQAGVPAPAAAAVCLLYRVFWYASGVVGAGSALARNRR
ncbi:MAG TPA: lysylphosphatidylglycerol synthase transmembrane domain-containing protein [Labilithrix sp.]|nr:lysylphosphatidylglycerol synthase transmembrane domain-containing protein [Labilithrix sp.]